MSLSGSLDQHNSETHNSMFSVYTTIHTIFHSTSTQHKNSMIKAKLQQGARGIKYESHAGVEVEKEELIFIMSV